MGATSLLNVTSPPLVAAYAASGIIRTRILLTIATSLHRDLHLIVRPATVISEIPGLLARAVVHHRLENILARLAETGRGRSLTIDDPRLGRREHDRARSAVLEPRRRHADRFALAFWQPVVGCGNRHRGGSGKRNLGRGLDAHHRRGVRIDALAVSAARGAQAVDHPHRVE